MSGGHSRASYHGLVLAASGLSLLASLGLVLVFTLFGAGAGFGGEAQVTPDGTGQETQTEGSEPASPLTVGTVVFFAVPVVIAAVPVFVRRRIPAVVSRATAAGLLFLWVLFLAFGGGIFYLPAAGLMAVAAILGGVVRRDDNRAA